MIRLQGVSVAYGHGQPWALREVSLEVERGEQVGVIGPPGSGKSTLLKVMAALVTPQEGELWGEGTAVFAGGEEVMHRWQRHVSMAFQQDALFDSLTVFENVAFPLRRRRLDEKRITEAVLGRLNDVGLAAAAQRYPSELSGGMRKRVGIARAVVTHPHLGLFDDPVAGLDPVTAAQILQLIARLTRKLNSAAVMISNDLDALLPMCSRVVMLLEGRVVFNDVPAALPSSAHPAVRQFITGSDEGPL